MPTGSRYSYFTSFLVKIGAFGRWKICQQELTTCNCKAEFFSLRWLDENGYELQNNEKCTCKACKTSCFLLLILQISCYFRRRPVLLGPSFCLVCLSWRDRRDKADIDSDTGNCDDDNAKENLYPHCGYFSFITSCSPCTILTKYATIGLQGEPLKWI